MGSELFFQADSTILRTELPVGLTLTNYNGLLVTGEAHTLDVMEEMQEEWAVSLGKEY